MTLLSSSMWRRYLALGMMMLGLHPCVVRADASVEPPAQDATEKKSGNAEAVQPKFIWGIILKFAATKAFEYFFEWSVKKLFHGEEQPLTLDRTAAVSAPGAATIGLAQKSAEVIVPKVTDNAPTSPLLIKGGKENYQGAFLSLLVYQPDGKKLTVRPIGQGFKSGEKFRIRIGATFDGELTLDNIPPKGERTRLYPENTEQVIKMRAGAQVILPLDTDSFFEFDEAAGEEQLVVTLRDPRAQGDSISRAAVHRQENAQGTGLLQEVESGKYAAIAESISLKHKNN